ncbi:ATP-binding protein [Dehalobacter restrictus]|uniref:DNA replication protein n=1 Tax=Dehalobacter restrictus (strain DSM 9455 / PER-K23) TaxID=871738 RepID=A0ABN4BVK8_DEHRP|nr:DNA replication protein [Dehalobacter restrictus DSM 9455]
MERVLPNQGNANIEDRTGIQTTTDLNPVNQQKTESKVQLNIQPEMNTESGAVCPLCGDRGIVLNGDTAAPCSCMEKKRIENSFKYARLSRELMNCRFEKFSLEYYRNANTQQDQEDYLNAQKALRAAREFVKNVRTNPHEVGLLFTGSVGSGKTFLAASIANEILENNHKLLFLIVPDLLDELRATFSNKSENTEYDLLDIARTVPILILDDLGAHNYTEWSRNRIYSILNYRMNEQLPTVITTNLDFDEIDHYLGERTCSRLLQMCRIFRLSAPQDIRMQNYLKREGLKKDKK